MKSEKFEDRIHNTLDMVWDISLFNYALLFITAFLVSALILIFFGFDYVLAFVPATIIVIFEYVHGKRGFKPIRTIEKGNPRLRERLSAAYDNKDKDNFIVRELVREVGYDLNNINTEKFVDLKRTNFQIIVSIIAVFLLLFLLLSDFEGLGLPDIMGFSGGGTGDSTSDTTGGTGGGSGNAGDVETGQTLTAGIGTPQSIYGDSSMARIEGEDMELEIHPGYGEGGDFDSEKDEDQEKVEEIKDTYAKATAAESYTENIPVELEGVVRRYFEKLAED